MKDDMPAHKHLRAHTRLSSDSIDKQQRTDNLILILSHSYTLMWSHLL